MRHKQVNRCCNTKLDLQIHEKSLTYALERGKERRERNKQTYYTHRQHIIHTNNSFTSLETWSLSLTCTCACMCVTGTKKYMYLAHALRTCTCQVHSKRQGKVNNYAQRQLLFFLERKNELPRVGFEPTTFCVLGERSTNWATEAAQLGRPNL